MSMFPFELSDLELRTLIQVLQRRVIELHDSRRKGGDRWNDTMRTELKHVEEMLARAKGVRYGRQRFCLR